MLACQAHVKLYALRAASLVGMDRWVALRGLGLDCCDCRDDARKRLLGEDTRVDRINT